MSGLAGLQARDIPALSAGSGLTMATVPYRHRPALKNLPGPLPSPRPLSHPARLASTDTLLTQPEDPAAEASVQEFMSSDDPAAESDQSAVPWRRHPLPSLQKLD